MTRLIRLIAACICLSAAYMAALLPAAYAAYWQIETVDTDFVGSYQSLAIDSSGDSHISYYDNRLGNLKYAKRTGSRWVTEVVTLAGKTNGQSNAVYTSIAVDSGGRPRIIYYDDNTAELKYAVKSGTGWTFEVVDAGCGVRCALNGYFPALALDSTDNPHVSYYGHGGGIANGHLKYAVKSASGWTTEIVDNDGDAGFNTSIALDSSGRPHISYERFPSLLGHGPNILRYATKASGSWTTEAVDASGRMVFSSIALDSSDNPRISYHDWNNGYLLYAERSLGGWHSERVDAAVSANVGRYNSLAVDRRTNASHISYFDISNRLLKYAVKAGPNWVSEFVDLTSGHDTGQYSRIALDPQGQVHISFYNATTYSLQHAFLIPTPALPQRPPDRFVIINPREFPIKVTVKTVCSESIGSYCLRERIVETCFGGNCFAVPPLDAGPICLWCGWGLSGFGGVVLGGFGAAWLIGWRRRG